MMRIIIETPDGHHIETEASGKYAPDVMHDLVARATEALTAAYTIPTVLAGAETVDSDETA